MTTTPPHKGKKRLAPETPTGKPSAKASRPSSPTASTTSSPSIGSRSSRRGISRSDIPATSNPATPSTPLQESPADPMDTDRSSTPVPDSLAFTTVEDEIDDDEAESSFKSSSTGCATSPNTRDNMAASSTLCP